VVAFEVDSPALERGRTRVLASLARAVTKGKLDAGDRGAALSHLTFTTDIDAFADRDLTIEAIVEREQDKVEMLSRLDKVVKTQDAILASNTSSIPIVNIAMATCRTDHVIGVHLFNPAPVLTLVELVPP
jgi:3-hydroxybutyryl-CoA dehydrogenase